MQIYIVSDPNYLEKYMKKLILLSYTGMRELVLEALNICVVS